VPGTVAHAYNPSYSGGRDQEDCDLSQPRQIVRETLSQKKKNSQKRAGGVAQGVDPEFKPQYHKKKSLTLSPAVYKRPHSQHVPVYQLSFTFCVPCLDIWGLADSEVSCQFWRQ
jgi:hypothetical protein